MGYCCSGGACVADTSDQACGTGCVDCTTFNGGSQPSCQPAGGMIPTPYCGCNSGTSCPNGTTCQMANGVGICGNCMTEADCNPGQACILFQCTNYCSAMSNCNSGSGSYCCSAMGGGMCVMTGDCMNQMGCGPNGVCK
jgi:hypothetical protein